MAVADRRAADEAEHGIDLSSAIGWVLAIVGFAVGARTISDNSFLTHLATGQLIAESGAIPTTDAYSFSATGEGWTVQSWLVSVLYQTLDASFGGWAIRLLHGLLGFSVVGLVWRLVTPATQLMTRVALTGIVIMIGTFLWPPRPLLVGLVATALVLQVIHGIRPPWWLVPIFWIWVNAHGSYVLGCGLLGATLLGAVIDERRLPTAELRLVGLGALGCLSASIGPLGWRLLWFPFHMMTRRDALTHVSEWGSPSFRAPIEMLFLSLLVLIVMAAARGARWRTLLPAIVFFVGGLLAVRNLGIASIVIVASIAGSLAGLGGTIDGSLRGFGARSVGAIGAAAAVIIVAGILTSAPVDVADYPIDEIDWLDERSLIADEQVRVAQRDYVGNYLTLRYGTDANVFMDDRFDFYPLAVIDDHNELLLGGDFGEVLDRWAFDVVLWATESPLRLWLETAPGWDIVLDGDDWFVACNTSSPVYERCT